MGNLGWAEIMVVLVIALIVFGPRKLPELGKTLGQSLAQFKRASEDFKRTWEAEVETEKRRLDVYQPAESHVDSGGVQEVQSQSNVAGGDGSVIEAHVDSGGDQEVESQSNVAGGDGSASESSGEIVAGHSDIAAAPAELAEATHGEAVAVASEITAATTKRDWA